MNDASERKPLSGTLLRFATALPLIALVVWILFHAPRWAFTIVLVLALVQGGLELGRMTLPGPRPLQVWNVLMTLSLPLVLSFSHDPRWIIATIATWATSALVVALLCATPIESVATRIGWLLGAPLYLGGLGSCLLLLFDRPDGGAWVLLAMILAFVSDTSAYFIGRAFGKRPLMPTVSPKKTVEGSIGGVVGATIGALIVRATLLPALPVVHVLALAIVGSLLGQAGDLFVSLIKRSVGVKDSGKLLPGHGGLLDRIDALLFTGAVTWAYASLLAA